jgi:hypothetical protein
VKARPSLDELLEHARRHGAECVEEIAGHLDERERVLLRIELNAIEAARRNGRFTIGARRRRSRSETWAMVEALRADGLVDQAIANRLGITLKWLRELESETGRNGGRKPAWLSGRNAAETQTGTTGRT